MTRAELIRKIKELAVEADAANEQAVAGVLWGLIGALAAGHDAALAHHVADFAREALSAINARWN